MTTHRKLPIGLVCLLVFAVCNASPAHAASGVVQPVAPAPAPVLCGIGDGITLSGTGALSCNTPSVGAAPRPTAPCQLTNVRLEGALAVDCERYHGPGVTAQAASDAAARR